MNDPVRHVHVEFDYHSMNRFRTPGDDGEFIANVLRLDLGCDMLNLAVTVTELEVDDEQAA